MGLVLTKVQMVVYTLIDMIKIIPHKNNYKAIPEVILDFIHLTINTNPHIVR